MVSDEIKSLIRKLMDTAQVGEGDYVVAPSCCADIYIGLSNLESALHSVEAEKEPEWISCDDRLPEISDGDMDSRAWLDWYGDGEPVRSTIDFIRKIGPSLPNAKWMRTGFNLPAPPEHKPE